MAEYIEREALIEKMNDEGFGYLKGIMCHIEDAPAADVVPRAEVEKIFAEIRKRIYEISQHHCTLFEIELLLTELKKKYTEERE